MPPAPVAKSNTGAIIGGVVGGFFGVAIIGNVCELPLIIFSGNDSLLFEIQT